MRKILSFEKKRKKISDRLRFLYLTMVLIPVFILGSFLIFFTYQSRMKQDADLITVYNKGARQTLYDITTYVYNVSESIVHNDGLTTLLTGTYRSSNEFVSAYNRTNIVDTYLSQYTGIGDIVIYTENPMAESHGHIVKANAGIREEEWYKNARNQYSPFWTAVSYDGSYGNRTTELALVRKLVLVGSEDAAILLIRVSNNYLDSRMENSGYETLIAARDGKTFFGTHGFGDENAIDMEIDYNREHFDSVAKSELSGRTALCAIESLKPYPSTNSQIYIASYDLNAYRNLAKNLLMSICVLLCAAVLPILILSHFAKDFTNEIVTLRNEMHAASHRIGSEPGTEKKNEMLFSNVELSDAYDDLLLMVRNIEEMEAAQYEAEIKEKNIRNDQQKMEFKMLASQINPHFLYNTLEMIRMKALTTGDRDVANAIKLLGQSMRYVLESTGTADTTLQKEFDHIMNYLQIQKLRFDDRLEYQVNIRPGMILSEYHVLPLLLQPVVENAIVHGVEKREQGGKIWIAIYLDGDTVFVDISDNGGGMDDETLNEVLRKVEHYEKERKTSGIALYNINRRIKLVYGEEYGVNIHTVYGEGTRVRISFPVNM